MSELKTSIIVDLKGNLDRQLKRNAQSIKRFSRNGSRDLDRLDKRTRKLGGSFGKLAGKLTGAAVAYSAFKAAGKVINFDAQLTQLQTDGRATVKQIEILKKSLFQIANDPSVRLDPTQLLIGFSEIIAQTGNLPDAMKNLENMALFMRATGTEAKAAGGLISIAFKNGVTEASQVLEILDAQLQQSLVGSVPIRDLARVGKGYVAPASAAIGPGRQTIIDSSAVTQITIDAVKTPDIAVEAIKTLLGRLADAQVQKTLRGAGVEVRQPGSKNLRQLSKVIPEIFNAADGDFGKLQKLFGEAGVKVFQGFSLPGNAEQLKRLVSIKADGSLLRENARINAGTAKAGLQSITNKRSQVASDIFSDPTKNLAKAFDSAQGFPMSTNIKHAGMALLDTATGYSAFKHYFDAGIQRVVDAVTSKPISLEEYGGIPKSKVQLEIKSDVAVKVNSITSDNLDLEVDAGQIMGVN